MRTEPGQQRRKPLLTRLGPVRPRPLPAHRTLALSLALAVIGLVLSPVALAMAPTTDPAGIRLGWLQLAGVFALAGIFVFHVEINSEAHTFSLSEVPLVLGLLFCQPWELVVARLVGEAVVLIVWERQSAPKLAFNLSVFFAESAVALAIFRQLARGGLLDPLTWLAALLAVGAAGLLGAGAVWTVIRVHGGRVSPWRLLAAACVTATGNTSLATIAAVLMSVAPVALVPLVVVAAVMIAAYRGYTRLTKRYAGLELLYQFTRITSGPQHPDETLRRVLAEACRLLRTRRASIALYAPDHDTPWLILDHVAMDTPDPPGATPLPSALRERVLRHGQLVLLPRTATEPWKRALLADLGAKDCLATPLISGGEITGVLVVCDRLGEVSTFDSEDGRLFATLASQAAIALENGQLIERLHDQIQAREHEALHDALTGLPNRVLFASRLADALADPDARQVGVFLLDLNGFKEVNDTLGHQAGDDLLRQVAQRLSRTVGDRGTVARLGGDEFAVLMDSLPEVSDGLQLGWEINEAISLPTELGSMTLEVGGSVGMSVWPDHGDDVSTLMQRADVAMYAAKQARSGVCLYDPEMDRDSEFRLRLAGELRGALGAHQIEVWYQPIARAVDVEVVSAEALARWHHPELGAIPPADFVPVAERSGLVHELTLYVLDTTLAQLRAWQDHDIELSASVNLPPQVLRDLGWSDKVVDLLGRHGVPPDRLTFEITETGIMTDPERMIGVLRELRSTGISFSIDDFGTGYSSLSYLQQLPVSTVKIDKVFVTDMVVNPADAAIARSVIDLARSLNLAVVAEGVEDQRTLDQLVTNGCDFIQGYFVSRPITAPELTTWLLGRRSRRPHVGDLAGRS